MLSKTQTITWIKIGTLISTFFLSTSCLAQQENAAADPIAQKIAAIQKECQAHQYDPTSTYFLDLHNAAIALDKKVCEQLKQTTTEKDLSGLANAFTEFGSMVRKSLGSTFSNTQIADNVNRQADYFEKEMQDRASYYFLQLERPKKLSTFTHLKSENRSAFRFSNFAEVLAITDSDETNCIASTSNKIKCSALLHDFSKAIAPYQTTLIKLSSGLVVQELEKVEKDWDNYWKNARALSFLDLALTSFIEHESSTMATSLTGPPARQWFVLHPNIVFEHVSGAPNGQRTKEALSIEWIGVNFWKKNGGRIPLGLSLTSLYSDRADLKSVGHGVTIYVDNKYALGVTRRDGKTGIFFSVDLLKALDNSKEKVLQLKNAL
ncbi:hypothetical protein [Undibacterium fentianense]|uniref:Uncharacterized protein n=1 Tax=Undibacterium fentianense TaxID=2828728 RepID=A0A941E207_9BURK|nr:hypothetical protein [Undibacterium fentianense]MBR7800920.1 hypothetical protein [Undibacterium fentianense]